MSSDDGEYDDYYDEDEDMMMDGSQDQDDDDDDDDEGMELDDGDNDDFKLAPKRRRRAYEIEYESLSQAAVERRMEGDVEHISGILGVDASTAALLLRSMAWNKERLIEKYMDRPAAMLLAAGVAPDRAAAPRRPPRPGFVCPVCFDDSASLRPLALGCQHVFCADCWAAYATAKITEDAEHSIRCMAAGCALVAPDPFLLALLDQPTAARFHDLILRHFVASDPALRFCPYPACTNTVACPAAAGKAVLTTLVPIVACGARGYGADIAYPAQGLDLAPTLGREHKFCFGCAVESDHRPVVCAVATMWLKKCRDDSETANWIKSNTKECPKCQSTIEKNGGCNHMTCKKCKHEFCWVCMGPWQEHGTAWYSCNRFDEKASLDARDAQSRSRASLERYLHYYNRWANHEQSAKLSVELYAKTEKKMEELQVSSTLTWIEVQFMRKAVEEAEKCRMTLKWTYAMAYYLAKTNEKALFEDNQRDLEKAVEDLSELLELPIEQENIPLLRQKVTDKTVYVQKRNEIVLDDTATGFLDGRWRWNVRLEGFEEPERGEVE